MTYVVTWIAGLTAVTVVLTLLTKPLTRRQGDGMGCVAASALG